MTHPLETLNEQQAESSTPGPMDTEAAEALTSLESGRSTLEEDEMTEVDVDDEGNNAGEYISRLERMIQNNNTSHNFTPEEEEAYEQQRREQLHEELVRIQRTNFMHFGILCMLPILMLVLVLITSLNQRG
eukprot:413507_1